MKFNFLSPGILLLVVGTTLLKAIYLFGETAAGFTMPLHNAGASVLVMAVIGMLYYAAAGVSAGERRNSPWAEILS